MRHWLRIVAKQAVALAAVAVVLHVLAVSAAIPWLVALGITRRRCGLRLAVRSKPRIVAALAAVVVASAAQLPLFGAVAVVSAGRSVADFVAPVAVVAVVD